MAAENVLSARAISIRNDCLVRLAAEFAVPIPADGELAILGSDLSLDEVWAGWQKNHPSLLPVVARSTGAHREAVPLWRSARVELPALVLLSTMLVFLAVRAQSSTVVLTERIPALEVATWSPVTDSVRAAVSAKLLAMARTSLPVSTSLSAAELASLMFSRSQPRQLVRLESLQSRIDTLLWVRGRVPGGQRFEFGGRVTLARRRRLELRVARLSIDGTDVPSIEIGSRLASIQTGVLARATQTWFEVADIVADVRVGQGSVAIVAWDRRVP